MNPFAALESDDEDESFTKVQSNKKTDAKKPVQAQKSVAAAPVVVGVATDKKAVGGGGRGGGGRGDNRNKGRGAGRGGKETGDRKNGKREYDRRSGTGRGTEVAKGGAGKGGWGTNEEEISQQVRELEAEGADKTATPSDEKDKTAETTVVVEEEPVEPEAPTFTLDEFLAKRDASRLGNSVFSAVETRKVTDDFSGLKTRTSDVDEAFIVLGAGKNKGNGTKAQRSNGQTKVTNLGFHSAPKEEFREERSSDRGGKGGKGSGGRGGDRGGKGGDRGGRGGGGDRRSAPRAGGKVDISDQSAFPSL